MYKPLKKRSMSKYSGPLSKMIDKEVEKRMSALPKTEQEEYEERKIDESTTEIKMEDGTFDRVTKSTFETVKPGSETGGTGVSYEDAFDNLSPEEQEKFGSLENFEKESKSYWSKENPEVRETREEEKVESFKPTPPPSVVNFGNYRDASGKLQYGEHTTVDGVKYNPETYLEKFGVELKAKGRQNTAGSYEKFERPERETGGEPMQFKAQSHMLKGRSMSFRNKK